MAKAGGVPVSALALLGEISGLAWPVYSHFVAQLGQKSAKHGHLKRFRGFS